MRTLQHLGSPLFSVLGFVLRRPEGHAHLMCAHAGRQSSSQLFMFKRFGLPRLRFVLEDPRRSLLLKLRGVIPATALGLESDGEAEWRSRGAEGNLR